MLKKLAINPRLLKKPLIVAVGALVVLVLLQLAYPHSRTRPFSKIGGNSYGYMTKNQVAGRIGAIDAQTINFKLSKKDYQASSRDIGLQINAEQVATAATQYSFKERLVPFSIFKNGSSVALTRSVDDEKLDTFVAKLVAENSYGSVSAKAVLSPSGTYVLEPAKSGLGYEAQKLRATITQELTTATVSTLNLTGNEIAPKVTDQKVAAAIESHKQLKQRSLSVLFGSTKVDVSADQLGAWALIVNDEAKGVAEVTYDQPALQAWLSSRGNLVAVPAVPTTIYIVDGAEQKRESGKNGQVINAPETASAVIDAMKNGKTSVQASVSPVASSQKVVRAYTSTSGGVLAMIRDWQAERKGARTAVYFQEIGGQGRSASVSADTSFFAASMYKLYIAFFLLNGIENQTINPSDQVIDGKDVSACIQAMIVVSHNGCPETIAARYGWNTIDGFITSRGFPSSVANGNIRVTAASLGDYLKRLHSGQLLNASSTQTLLGYMSQQIYRSAIPAGVPGSLVQNKVGFYGGSWHDAGIVYSPKGTYILVVLTEGAGASAIADLSRRINTIL